MAWAWPGLSRHCWASQVAQQSPAVSRWSGTRETARSSAPTAPVTAASMLLRLEQAACSTAVASPTSPPSETSAAAARRASTISRVPASMRCLSSAAVEPMFAA